MPTLLSYRDNICFGKESNIYSLIYSGSSLSNTSAFGTQNMFQDQPSEYHIRDPAALIWLYPVLSCYTWPLHLLERPRQHQAELS